MTPVSRRTVLVAAAAVAGAGIAAPAATPLGRIVDGVTSATTATPDPAIAVGYRLDADAVAPRPSTPRPPHDDTGEEGDSTPAATPTETPQTPIGAPSVGSTAADESGGGASTPNRGGSAPTTTTVERDTGDGPSLLTTASVPPLPLERVDPGGGGRIAIAVDVGDQPVRLGLRTSGTADENGVSESEVAAGDTTLDVGELADFVVVRLSRTVAPAGDAGGERLLFEGTLADLLAATPNDGPGLSVPGDRTDGRVSAGARCDIRLDWTLLASAADFAARGLPAPGDVNLAQTDRVDLAIDVDARTDA